MRLCMNIAATSQLSIWIGSTIAATFAFWTCFGACVDTPLPPSPPEARIVVAWDPLACGTPHRVAVELEDEDGARLMVSTACELGLLMVDAPHFGIYRGRIYAWSLGEPERSIVPVQLVVDQPIVRWNVMTPK
jgi:hypothetical protein